MRKYEAVFIYPPGDAALATGKQIVTDEFKNANVSILDEKDMGERTLAYEVSGSERGRYHLYNIEADPETIAAMTRSLRIKGEILRFSFFRHEPRLRQNRPTREPRDRDSRDRDYRGRDSRPREPRPGSEDDGSGPPDAGTMDIVASAPEAASVPASEAALAVEVASVPEMVESVPTADDDESADESGE